MALREILRVGAAAAALAGTALAATPAGFYLEGSVGGNWPQQIDPQARAALVGPLDFDGGWFVAGAAGYKLDYGMRLELEGSYRLNDANEVLLASPYVGDASATAIMLNAIYDIPISPGWQLSLGGGVGLSRVGFEIADTAGNRIDDRDFVFAYQGIAELGYQATDTLGVFVGYNYFVADNFGVEGTPARLFQDDYRAHTAMVGLRYSFVPPAAPPQQPPPPPPPEVKPAQTFIVFFEFDRSDLTPTAQQTIADAAAAYKATGAVSVQVVGHTDTVGSAAYNQRLSERRAASVKAGLVGAGVPDAQIATTGRGFSEPLVATGPGVKEPQNRRATIDLTGTAGM